MDSIINLPELFEEVLHQLPFLDLVIATGVNHTFRNFISSSPKLQRKLFQLPSPPPKSEKEQKHFSKRGIFGPYLDQDICLSLAITWQAPRTVILCPFLLEPCCIPNTLIAHLTTRAAEANFWPNMYLTDPPCAHAHVFFQYVGVNKNFAHVIIEANRTLYRRDGVTFVAIEEALSQIGAVTIRVGRTTSSMHSRFLDDTALSDEVTKYQQRWKCKLSMNVGATTISLHGTPRRLEEVSSGPIPVRHWQGLYAWGARKTHFVD
jgi:hypothetical protein